MSHLYKFPLGALATTMAPSSSEKPAPRAPRQRGPIGLRPVSLVVRKGVKVPARVAPAAPGRPWPPVEALPTRQPKRTVASSTEDSGTSVDTTSVDTTSGGEGGSTSVNTTSGGEGGSTSGSTSSGGGGGGGGSLNPDDFLLDAPPDLEPIELPGAITESAATPTAAPKKGSSNTILLAAGAALVAYLVFKK